MVKRGLRCATRPHRSAIWADGEPDVCRFDPERPCKLLAELDLPEPELPPYDPAKHPRFEWQDEVEAVIADLERQKAERDAQEEAARGEPLDPDEAQS